MAERNVRRAAAPREPREVGRRVVASMRRTLAERLAEAWRSDPECLAKAVDLGIINPDWVDQPSAHSFSSVAPIEVIERFLERTAEQRPSMLASLGLSALQVLGAADAEPGRDAAGPGAERVEDVTHPKRLNSFSACPR